MGRVMLCRVDYVGRDLNGTSASFTFDDIISVSLRRRSGTEPSRATVVLKNTPERFRTGFSQPFNKYVGNDGELIFREGDSVKIYAAAIESWRSLDTSSGSADLLMSGEIAEYGVNLGHGNSTINLEIVDKTYVMFNRVFTYAFQTSDSLGADDLVQKVVRSVTDDVDSDGLKFDGSGNLVSNGLYGVDARLVSSGGYIENTRVDGSVFPTISMAKVAKPAFEWLNELSSVNNTNDFTVDDPDAPVQNRNMLFYVDESNKFHWYYPLDGTQSTLSSSIASSDTSLTLTDASTFPTRGSVFVGSERITYTGKSTNTLTGLTRGANNTTAAAHSSGDRVTTMVTIVEGDTSTGHEVLTARLNKKVFDIVNLVLFNCGVDLNGNGISDYFFDRTTKSKTLKETFKSWNDISRDLIEEEIRAGNLIKDNTQTNFTYKGNFYKANTYGFTTTWGVSTTGFSDDDYNTSLRSESISIGTGRAQNLTQGRSKPRWKGSIELTFNKYPVGDLIEFTSTRGGLNSEQVRITDVTYQITKSGGFASLSVKEDEAKIGEV